MDEENKTNNNANPVADTAAVSNGNGVTPEETKSITEAMYKQNLELARLYKQVESLNHDLGIANDKLKDLDRLKSEFLGLASHQLRSPLTAIKGYTSMLLEGSYGAVSAEQKTAIDRVYQSSQNLSRVIEDLLDVSKIEQGGMKYIKDKVDIKKLVKDITEELSISAKGKGLELSFVEQDEGNYLANADTIKIRQVVTNLIDNSIKYTKEGSIKVIVGRPMTGVMRVTITDTGMGISPENIAKLFEKFSRGEGGKVNAGGSGLGLYLAKEIVLAHGGKIWVESPGVGKGSSFIFELPEVNA